MNTSGMLDRGTVPWNTVDVAVLQPSRKAGEGEKSETVIQVNPWDIRVIHATAGDGPRWDRDRGTAFKVHADAEACKASLHE